MDLSLLNRVVAAIRGDLTDPIGMQAALISGNSAEMGGNAQAAHPDWLGRVNACFLAFGDDPQENIRSLVNLCGELLNADVMLYNRLEGELLVTAASWQAPPDYRGVDVAEGHICFDVILQANHNDQTPDRLIYIRNLPETKYFQSDPNVRQFGLHTYVGQPVRAAGRAVGSFCAVFQRDYQLDPRDENLLGILASAIGVEERRWRTIENLQNASSELEEIVQARTTELLAAQSHLESEIASHRHTEASLRRVSNQQEWLIDSARHLTGSLDLHDVLFRIGEGARQILYGEACAIYLLDPDGKTLRPVLAFDEPYQEEVLSFRLDVDASLTGQAVKNRRTMIFNDIENLDGAAHIPGTPVELDERMIAAPFIIDDEVLGVMTHNRVGVPFTQEDAALAGTFADYAAVALNNARMYASIHNTLDALQHSESRYTDLFEQSPVAIYVHDMEGNILDTNPLVSTWMGYSRDELKQMNISQLGLPENSERLLEWLKLMIEQGAASFESLHVTRDGRRVPVQVNARLQHVDGKPRVFSFVLDITERKEQELEREAIIQVSQALRTASRRDDMYPILSSQLAEVVDACCVRIYQQSGAGNLALLVDERGPCCPSRPPEGWLESDVRQSITRQQVTQRSLAGSDGRLHHILILPLIAQSNPVGAVMVGRERTFSELERRVIATVADVSASALHRAELHEETRRQLRRLEALHTIEMAITSILDLDTLLKIVVEHVVELLDVDAADILLYENPTLGLSYATGQGFQAQTTDPARLREAFGQARQAVVEQRKVYIPDVRQQPLTSRVLHDWLEEEGFVSYLGVPLEARGRILGVMEIFLRRRLSLDQDWVNFMDTLARQTATAIENTSLVEDLQRGQLELTLAYDKTLEGWAKALELRDKETEGHSRAVTEKTLRLARRIGMAEDHMVHVYRGTLLHDIGKMAIPDDILKKPGPLGEDEWEIMRSHPGYAFELLSPIPYLAPALEIPYCHHERWDGSGYPRKLHGEQIPLAARIFSVVDVWEALRTDRPYRKAWPEADVRTYLREQAGVLFDPRVVVEFLELLEEEDDAFIPL